MISMAVASSTYLTLLLNPGGGGLLPYKGLMGTCGQPGYVFRDFCLKQGIEFIIFCLKQDIFSWTINSKIFTSSNVN